ncbi:MAG: PAS domain-containing protein [Pseudomonadota bacterium]
MNFTKLRFEVGRPGRSKTSDPAAIGVSADDAFVAMSAFDEIGIWRAELDSGLVYWTDSVFRIYGLEVKEGPVSIPDAIAAYHPEDRDLVLQCVEEASAKKTGFRFVLRLCRASGEIVWVKSHGMYRVNAEGREELFGYIEQFSPLARSVTILDESVFTPGADVTAQ